MAAARPLRRRILKRLGVVAAASPGVQTALARSQSSPTTPTQLAEQLLDLASLIESLAKHDDEHVRVLAEHRQLGAAQAAELKRAAEAIQQAVLAAKKSAGKADRERQQALLDVLDGLALLLLGEVLDALNELALSTPGVRRPTLYQLRSYFQRRRPEDASDEPLPS